MEADVTQVADGDLIVVLPGVLGSILARNGRQTWGYRKILGSLHKLADTLTDELSLPPEAFDHPAEGFDDGTRPTGTLRTVGIVPGLFTIDGYDDLLAALRRRFPGDTVLEFPYDWRQSNEYSARLLQATVEPILDRRRRDHPRARLVLLAHSMGGLVARYYAECLDTRKLTRRVITFGTPYRGAAKALAVLANGAAAVGPFRLRLGELVRSLPSVAELLPTYACVGDSADALRPLAEVTVPGLPERCRERGLRFHADIEAAIVRNGTDRPSYHAILSHRQSTVTWTSVAADGTVVAHAPGDFAERGDGTVPRCSAAPPEWHDDAASVFVAGRHAALQQQREVLTQIQGILTARRRPPMAVADEIAVDADSHVLPGGTWTVSAQSVEQSDKLVLEVTVSDPVTCEPLASRPMRPAGDGRYEARLPWMQAGLFRWHVHSTPLAATPVDPVSDVLLCTTA
ncbi:hypothetical protein F6X68_09925 [Micromonospora sp. AMSO12t]|uniref:lipase/acyltransferase domain-containing protein n=1 Tax=Micromonospora sp. AMSO12t TaxID=2650410 RepID=UPI00124B19E4|nr:hypothetical protein [Micromonospora sp. AMSO12t]KAB1159035.1 hypothetical protein F6X68_09925 [Micromonospora sp. AMSO12t]